MYVCVCRSVTEADIRVEMRAGACTMRDLRERLGVATQCGRCGKCARDMLTEGALERRDLGGHTIEPDALLPSPA